MNVYCSFVSLSLSACFHPLGIVCVNEHYSLFLCLSDSPSRMHTHTNTHSRVGGVGIKGSLAHTTLMESRCREWAALLKLCWRSVSTNLCLGGGVKCYQARSMPSRGLPQQAQLRNWDQQCEQWWHRKDKAPINFPHCSLAGFTRQTF